MLMQRAHSEPGKLGCQREALIPLAQELVRPACQTNMIASYAEAQGHAVGQTVQTCKHPPLQASIPLGCPSRLCTAVHRTCR